MAEEVKKSRPAPDPNSAKYMLGQIAAKAYSDAMEAKSAERDGWLVSPANFPAESRRTLGTCASATRRTKLARIAARGGGEKNV
ncbi:MAG: hypothetical protein ACLUD2_21840 [Clostridium sp.]